MFKRWVLDGRTNLTPVSIFVMLWCLSIIAHLDDRMYWYQSGIYFASLLVAFVGLFFARSTIVVLSVIVLQLFACWTRMPDVDNHWFFVFFVNITFLCSYCYILSRNNFSFTPTIDQRWIRVSFPVVRWLTILLYFFAVFHKLNAGFFNPERSCAVFFHDAASSLININFLKEDSLVLLEDFLIYGIFILELLIPVFLFNKRTWFLGIVVGVFFHLSTSLFMRNFPTIMFTMYFLFIPTEGQKNLIQAFENIIRKITFGKIGLIALLKIQAALWSIWAGMIMIRIEVFDIKRLSIESGLSEYLGAWTFFAVIAFILMVITILKERLFLDSRDRHLWVRHKVFLLVLALFFINGISPYLGLKTQTSFAMWSNLVPMKKYSNHFVMRSDPIKIFPYVDDMVEIIATNVEPLAEKYIKYNQYIAFSMLKRAIQDFARQKKGDIRLYYIRNGQEYGFEQAQDAEIFKTQEPYWFRKLVKIKPFPKNLEEYCTW